MKHFLLIVALGLTIGCERERHWRTEGEAIVVDNSGPLERAPLLRCVTAEPEEYRCDTVGQFDGGLVQRGYYVKVPRSRYYALHERVFQVMSGTSPSVRETWDFDRDTILVLAFTDFGTLYSARRIVWFIPEEYMNWMASGEGSENPYPLDDAVLAADIGRVLKRRCGEVVQVRLSRSANGGYEGVAESLDGPSQLSSNDGVYWAAEGPCAAIDLQRENELTAP